MVKKIKEYGNSLDQIISDKYIYNRDLNIKDLYQHYGLNNIITQDGLNNIIIQDKKILKIKKPTYFDSYFLPQQPIGGSQRAINWGDNAGTTNEPRAYIQPTPEEIEKVLEAMHMVGNLPADQQRQLIEATKEIRYFVDGQIRARFGATNHFNAIRCLNNPEVTDVATPLSMDGVQLAGEEYFGLNRFMVNYPDIADIQWWALYQGGSWHLDTWNPEGEHLDTGVNGWGNLVGSVLKINGQVLGPQEIVAIYRTMRLRNERGFQTDLSFEAMQQTLRLILFQAGELLPARYDDQLEELSDLSLVDSSGKVLTYVGQSMIIPTMALQRKVRQENEPDPEIRRIIDPILFN
ncbi:MAG: hypothetical protein KKA65_01055 [Nanoarchaeota archaeon]|nr:hypothetical protein [Nanoarchaeota archaeon]MCG2720300.1 hypothetical protein [Nanoarchaeota archaeon]